MSRLDRDLSEEQFTRQVIDLALAFKWRVHHDRPARTKKGWRTPVQGTPGFFDLVLARRGVVIFAELKTRTGRQNLSQKLWEEELEMRVHDLRPGEDPDMRAPRFFLWRPADMRAIEEQLR